MKYISPIYEPGNRLVTCDVCGLTARFNDVRRAKPGEAHAGLIVCPECDDGRHPNEDPIPSRPEGIVQRVE